jgi:flagellar biosynthesis protein FlhF
MKIKTFYARTMAEALVDIKATLGPDALILSTKAVARRSGIGGSVSGFQVVAATDSAHEAPQTSPDRIVLTGSAAGMLVPKAYGEDAAVTPGAKGSLQRPLSPASPPKIQPPPRARASRHAPSQEESPRGAVIKALVGRGLAPDLAMVLAEKACVRLPAAAAPDGSALFQAVLDAALAVLPAAPTGAGIPAAQIVTFVGPAGAGKTTVVAKLAASLALTHRRKVVLVTLDTYRIGAAEQLRTYAGLMGLPFRVAATPEEFKQAIADHAQRNYIIVDTPGRYLQDPQCMSEMIPVLTEIGPSECHLVLSATTKLSDLKHMSARFEPWKPGCLVFTRLDETTTPGSVASEVIRTRKPLSYFTDGPRIPEDLHVGTPECLLDMILKADSHGELTWKEELNPDSSAVSIPRPKPGRSTRKPRRKPAVHSPARASKLQQGLLL